MTPREYKALADVYEAGVRRWAYSQAMFANAHFRGKDDAAFIPEDFMGKSDRQERQRELQQSMIAAQRANASLMMMKPGDKPEGLPSWALGE